MTIEFTFNIFIIMENHLADVEMISFIYTDGVSCIILPHG